MTEVCLDEKLQQLCLLRRFIDNAVADLCEASQSDDLPEDWPDEIALCVERLIHPAAKVHGCAESSLRAALAECTRSQSDDATLAYTTATEESRALAAMLTQHLAERWTRVGHEPHPQSQANEALALRDDLLRLVAAATRQRRVDVLRNLSPKR